MADDLTKKGAQDRSRINIHEEYELRYWSSKFGVSTEHLKAAVKKVGNSAQAVETELPLSSERLIGRISSVPDAELPRVVGSSGSRRPRLPHPHFGAARPSG